MPGYFSDRACNVDCSGREKSKPRNGAGEIFIAAVAEIARATVSAANARLLQSATIAQPRLRAGRPHPDRTDSDRFSPLPAPRPSGSGRGEVLVPIVHRLELTSIDRPDRDDSLGEQAKPSAQHDELNTGDADRGSVVLAEIGDHLEVRHRPTGQPSEFPQHVSDRFWKGNRHRRGSSFTRAGRNCRGRRPCLARHRRRRVSKARCFPQPARRSALSARQSTGLSQAYQGKANQAAESSIG